MVKYFLAPQKKNITLGFRVNLEQKIANFTIYNDTNITEHQRTETTERRDYVLLMYTIMIILTGVFNLSRAFALFGTARRASINLHKHMTDHIINATMQFFDTNFIGNVLNRFSKDLTVVDEFLPFIFHHLFRVSQKICKIKIANSSIQGGPFGRRDNGADRNSQHSLPDSNSVVLGAVDDHTKVLSTHCSQFEEIGRDQ
jgi:ABC-type multidrug transport system fused ATPase/permease subunit